MCSLFSSFSMTLCHSMSIRSCKRSTLRTTSCTTMDLFSNCVFVLMLFHTVYGIIYFMCDYVMLLQMRLSMYLNLTMLVHMTINPTWLDLLNLRTLIAWDRVLKGTTLSGTKITHINPSDFSSHLPFLNS